MDLSQKIIKAKAIGADLKKIREELKISPAKIAAQSGLTIQQIRSIEDGVIFTFGSDMKKFIDFASKYSEFLGKDHGEIWFDHQNPEPNQRADGSHIPLFLRKN